MAFTECYVQTTGSNLNAGSTTADAASRTYTSVVLAGGWNQATGVFTVASGDPAADGVAVGDFASVYVTAGATIATFVGRITARDATTITVSLTAVSGTPPATDALGATTLKVGGAWAGPNAAVGFPFNFVATAMTNAAGDTPRVNIKGGTNYNITAAISHTLNGPTRFQGYTTAINDGGRATIDGGVAGASYTMLTVSGTNVTLADLILQNNGASASAGGFNISGTETICLRCVAHSLRGTGFNVSSVTNTLVECEAYGCNQSNTASLGGFVFGGVVTAIRCVSHDNAGSNSMGFRCGSTHQLLSCIADSNGGYGFEIFSATTVILRGCEAYNNTSDGIVLSNTGAGCFYLESCNLIKNGGWGINGSGAGARNGSVKNCGFGAGTQANTSGTTTGLKSMTEEGTVTYSADVTPWVAPATGDFRITLAAAKGTGRGTYTQTQAGYTGTVGYPDIGAAQQRSRGGLGIPSIGRGAG